MRWSNTSFFNLEKVSAMLSWGGIILLCIHGIVVCSYGASVPFLDEIDNFREDHLSRSFSWQWLIEMHNEHRLVFTKLLTWLLLILTDMQPIVQICLNYCLYLGLCMLLHHTLSITVSPWVALLCPILATTLPWEIHVWAFQTHFYANILFALLGFWGLQKGAWWMCLGALWFVLAIFTFSSGLLFALLGILFCCILMLWQRESRAPGCIAILLILVSMAFWAHGQADYEVTRIPWHFPHEKIFWAHLAAQMAHALGIEQRGLIWLGMLWFVGSTILLMYWLWLSLQEQDNKKLLMPLLFMGGLWLNIVVVSLSRADLGYEQGFDSRYTGVGLLYVYGCWAFIARFLQERRYLLLLGACLLSIGYSNDFHYIKVYKERKEYDLACKACIWGYFRGENDGKCAMVLPWAADKLPQRLERAWALNVYFVQEFQKVNPTIIHSRKP